MGANFSRVKTWIGEKLTSADINAEFNNILDNLTPSGMDDHSPNVAGMQVQTDPGEVSTESLPTSLAGEIERLRHEIAEMKGETYWYTAPDTNLAAIQAQLVSDVINHNAIISGTKKSTSEQSLFIVPEGAGNGDGFTVLGTTTNLLYNVEGVSYTLAADVVQGTTVTAPNASADVNDLGLADQDWTKFYGTHGGAIEIDNIGAAISTKNQTRQTFRVGTEYFTAMVDTSRFQLRNLKRGIFFDDAGAPIVPVTIADGDSIELMTTSYIFLSITGTLAITNNEPIYSDVEPTSPASGDYWYDMSAVKWMVYDGAAYNDADATYIGMAITDENDECVAARSVDFAHTRITDNTVELDRYYNSAGTLQLNKEATIGVFGNILDYKSLSLFGSPSWDAGDLDTGTIAGSTLYFYYITEAGIPKISLQAPVDMEEDRGGLYHPSETWRAVGQAYWTSTSATSNVISYFAAGKENVSARSSVAASALTLQYFASPLVKHSMPNITDDNLGTPDYFHVPFYMGLVVPSGATLGHTSGEHDNVVLHIGTRNTRKSLMIAVSSHQWGVQSENKTPTLLGTGSDLGKLYTATGTASIDPVAVAWGEGAQTTAGTWDANLDFFLAGNNLDICRVFQTATSGTWSTGTGSIVDVFDWLEYECTYERKVRITLVADETTAYSAIEARVAAGTIAEARYYIQNTNAAGSPSNRVSFSLRTDGTSGTNRISTPPGGITYMFDPNNGEVFPQYFAAVKSTGDEAYVTQCKMLVEEMPIGYRR